MSSSSSYRNATCSRHDIAEHCYLGVTEQPLVSEEFEDAKGVIKINKSQDRQHNGQQEKVQKEIQRSKKHKHKAYDRVTQTPLKNEKPGVKAGAPEG